MEILRYNQKELPNEEWIRDYLYYNYKYFNEAISILNESGRPKWINELNDVSNVIAIYAYNNSKILYIQANEMLNVFKYKPTIVWIDDSTDSTVSNDIKSLATFFKGYYWKVPRFNFFENDIDIYWHNQAINLSYYHLFEGLDFDQLVMLDHDIIPFSQYDIPLLNENQLWYGSRGLNDYKDGKVYPWPGFSIFNMRSLRKCKFNFFQDWVRYKEGFEELDTGGAMSKYINDSNSIVCSCERYEYENDYFEIIDNCWLHLRDTSNWSGKELNKMGLFKELYQNNINFLKNKYKKLT